MAKGLPKKPECNHRAGTFHCTELSMQDIRKIHERYYQNPDLKWKQNYILQHVTVKTPKRKMVPEGMDRRRNVSTEFTLPKHRGGTITNVRVCRAAFLSILQEKRDRLNRLCQKYLETGVAPNETRGGDRRTVKYQPKRHSIKEFVKTFRPIQSHYTRGKNLKRQYLPSELNIKKMWSMYTEKHQNDDLSVDYEYFRNVFTRSFNISFDSPYLDKCSTCCCLENKILLEKDKKKKTDLKTMQKVHKTRADAFYKKLRLERANSLTFSYDCQKNLALPKVPDQAAYYSRQLYLYNFTICQGLSSSPQTKDNTFSYLWTENEYAKGCNQIASALHHRLCSSNLEGISLIRLFSDGCGGQNKNKGMLGMLSHWLLFEAPTNVQKIVIFFPVVGHSFIPPDRVFGKLERRFKKSSVIEAPEDYINIIKEHTTAIHLGKVVSVKNWKAYSDDILKQPGQWHFKFQKSKKITITRSHTNKIALVQGDPYYNIDVNEPKSLCKKGKNFRNNGQIEIIQKGIEVKQAKLKDVKKLLTLHFGETWEENQKLQYFKDVLKEYNVCTEEDEEGSEILSDFELPEDDGLEFA